MPGTTTNTRYCRGYTISGQQCRKIVKGAVQFCYVHERIDLPSYVTVTPQVRFWVYTSPSNWRIGDKCDLTQSPRVFQSLGAKESYTLNTFISEGTYGAVYYATKKSCGTLVALKISKRVFVKKNAGEGADFMREYYVHKAINERCSSSSQKIAVSLIDSFLLRNWKTGRLHGCLVMERMDGNISDLFYGPFNQREMAGTTRLWVEVCRFISYALHEIHTKGIYHLDMKPGNVLYKKQTSGKYEFLLIDFGLSCLIDHIPEVPCRATGTYIPIEWRISASNKSPSFDLVTDPCELNNGEVFSACTTFDKLRRDFSLSAKSRLCNLLFLIKCGMCDKVNVRKTTTFSELVEACDNILCS